jgi:hypothetical protein
MDKIKKLAKDIFYETRDLPTIQKIKDRTSITIEDQQEVNDIWKMLNTNFSEKYILLMFIKLSNSNLKLDYNGVIEKIAEYENKSLYLIERKEKLKISLYNHKDYSERKKNDRYNIIVADINCQIYELDTKLNHYSNNKNDKVVFRDVTSNDDKNNIFLIKEAEVKIEDE